MIYWVIGVFVGVLTSLLAAYAKPHIDRLLSRFSRRIRERNAKRKAEWAHEVSELVGNLRKQNLCVALANTNLTLAVLWILLSVFIMSLAGLLFFKLNGSLRDIFIQVMTIVSAYNFAISLIRIWGGNRYLRLLSDAYAEEKRKKNDT
jgi:hypothetical protein